MTRRAGLLAVVAALALVALSSSAEAAPALRPAVHHASAAVNGARTFHVARASTHIAVYWRGSSKAAVRVAFSRDGRRFGKPRAVQVDDAGQGRKPGVTYGTMMVARGVTAVRVTVDRKLARVTVLSLTDRGAPVTVKQPAAHAAAAYAQPPVTPRSGWGADESLRYDSTGNEIWPPAFYPVQKLIVHHTDTQNNDPDPAATVRSIYYYHAITQGWGDIGYNFLIDESGRIYEGRHSRTYAPGESPTGQDLQGNGVIAAHAQGFNSGTVGVALLGTLTNQDATPAARHALEQLLAWEAAEHGIDPRGSSLYTNPVNGTQKTFPNIAGHRDVNATECPGGVFYATLPTIRSDVAAMIAGSPPPPATVKPTASTGTASPVGSSTATIAGTVNPNGSATTYFFQYGTSTAYSSTAPSPAASAGSGTSTQAVSVALGGLRRKTKYHYRLVASNSAGTTYGTDRVFNTSR